MKKKRWEVGEGGSKLKNEYNRYIQNVNNYVDALKQKKNSRRKVKDEKEMDQQKKKKKLE